MRSVRLKPVASLGLLVMVAGACCGAELRVQVLNAFSGEKVGKFELLYRGPDGKDTLQADDEGVIVLKDLSEGEVSLEAIEWFATPHVGRIGPAYGGVRIPIPYGHSIVNKELFVVPVVTFRGRVVNAKGEPIRDARVSAFEEAENRGWQWEGMYEASTDARGEFEFVDEGGGRYAIHVAPPGPKNTIQRLDIGGGPWGGAFYGVGKSSDRPMVRTGHMGNGINRAHR